MKTLHYLGLLLQTNWRAALALRGAFSLQVAFMALNNWAYFLVWVMLWDFLVTFSIYPEPIFGGGIRILLFTLLPAAFSGFLPARLAHHPTVANLASALGGAAAVVCVALLLFQRGLRRYESGSQIGAR